MLKFLLLKMKLFLEKDFPENTQRFGNVGVRSQRRTTLLQHCCNVEIVTSQGLHNVDTRTSNS